MSKYAIWDKKTPVITPIGEVLTPEQWIERYPVAGLESITVLCSAGEINGGFFGTLGQMKTMYENEGADFSDCESNEDILQRIEEFEAYMNMPSGEPSVEERQMLALEAIASGQTTENAKALNILLGEEE